MNKYYRVLLLSLLIGVAHSFVSPKVSSRKTAFNQPEAFRLNFGSDDEVKKETTWDRITGPKLFKTVTNWNGIHAVPLVPLRIITGALMIHHGSEGE